MTIKEQKYSPDKRNDQSVDKKGTLRNTSVENIIS
jgi:hypothetical protein